MLSRRDYGIFRAKADRFPKITDLESAGDSRASGRRSVSGSEMPRGV